MRRVIIAIAIGLYMLGARDVKGEVISVAPRDSAGLVAALEYAERTPGADMIELAPRSLYALTAPGREGESQGLPTVRSEIRILGNGSEIRRYSNTSMLLVAVDESGALRLEHLTLAEGDRGAIVNRGRLSLFHVSIVDNTAHGADAIVRNYGELEAADCVIGWNEIAGAQRDAGTLLNYGRAELVRTRIEANAVSRRYGSLVEASAILNFGQVRLDEVVLRGNDARDDHDGDDALGTVLNLGNGRLNAVRVESRDNLPAMANVLPTAR